MQDMIGIVLLMGTLISAVIVILGGLFYLLQYGNENMHTEFLQSDTYQLSIKQLWQMALSFSSKGIIMLGLLSLVMTQIVRVALLTWFYMILRDYWFILFSVFILIVLIYSFFLRTT
jgi:uncharacterized membrane protein